MENVRKNGLRLYYDSLPAKEVKAPKAELIKRLAAVTKVHTQTVKGWLYGTYTPDALRQELISKELGIPVEQLF